MCVFFSPSPTAQPTTDFRNTSQLYNKTGLLFGPCRQDLSRSIKRLLLSLCFSVDRRWSYRYLKGIFSSLGASKEEVQERYKKHSWCKQNTQASNQVTEFSTFAQKINLFSYNKKQQKGNRLLRSPNFCLYVWHHKCLTCPPCSEQSTQPTWMLPCLAPGMICSRSKSLPKITTSQPEA